MSSENPPNLQDIASVKFINDNKRFVETRSVELDEYDEVMHNIHVQLHMRLPPVKLIRLGLIYRVVVLLIMTVFFIRNSISQVELLVIRLLSLFRGKELAVSFASLLGGLVFLLGLFIGVLALYHAASLIYQAIVAQHTYRKLVGGGKIIKATIDDITHEAAGTVVTYRFASQDDGFVTGKYTARRVLDLQQADHILVLYLGDAVNIVL